jgi:hypothetical protein
MCGSIRLTVPEKELHMTSFRMFLVLIFTALTIYTGVVAANHGLNLLPVFFGDMAKLAWPGQFNLDFLFMLALSGLWVAWRHHFRVTGIVLGLLAFLGGSLFLSAYLLVESYRCNGNVRHLLIGPDR